MFGGLELAALAGAPSAAVSLRLPVLLDGYAVAAAALAAVQLDPLAGEGMIATHRSAEPGHQLLLTELGLEPLLDLRLRLGEASGALLALPLIESAGALHRRMERSRSRALTAQSEPVVARPRRVRRAWVGLVGAITFLTIVPMPAAAARQDEFDLSRTLAWFPLVGGAIGAFAGALRVACQPLFGRGPSTAIAMVGLVAISGALHQDALADTADGLGVRGDRARRLAAMRDSATGAFGVLALIGWALLLFTALEPLGSDQALRALIAAGAAGRLAALLHGIGARPARTDGPGAELTVEPSALAIATLIAGAIIVAVAGPGRGAISLSLCGLVSALSALLARRTIGGSTGDTIGAAVAVTEVAVCLALSGLWR